MAWLVNFRPSGSGSGADDDTELLDRYEVLLSRLWDAGMTGIGEGTVDGHEQLSAGFDTRDEAEAASVLGTGFGLQATITPADDNWFSTEPSMVSVPGTGIDGFVVTAGASFGHGGHPTTVLALELLGRLTPVPGRVLDLGTGSGVLAIAARLLGAGSVMAIDIDAAAVAIAADNARTNHVAVEVSGDSAAELAARGQRFDLILANVLVTVHEEVSGPVATMLAPEGRLIVSGFIDGQAGRVLSAYRRAVPGIETMQTLRSDPWRAELLIRPSSPG